MDYKRSRTVPAPMITTFGKLLSRALIVRQAHTNKPELGAQRLLFISLLFSHLPAASVRHVGLVFIRRHYDAAFIDCICSLTQHFIPEGILLLSALLLSAGFTSQTLTFEKRVPMFGCRRIHYPL